MPMMGSNCIFVEGGFQKLKRLTVKEMKKLKMVEVERGSLPGLEQLEIGPCSMLMEVPSGIQHLKSLKILNFFEMQGDFVLRMQPDGGKDFWKIKKVTTIYFSYRIKGERYKKYKLGDSDLFELLQG
jgi:disease resistance protein RPM1